jgi:hypothetical protein
VKIFIQDFGKLRNLAEPCLGGHLSNQRGNVRVPKDFPKAQNKKTKDGLYLIENIGS